MFYKLKFVALSFLLALGAGFGFGVEAASAASLKVEKVRLGQNKEVSRLVIETNQSVRPKMFTLPNPPRVVLDFPNVSFKPDLQDVKKPEGSVVNSMRQGQFDHNTVRMVLDVDKPVVANMFFLPKSKKYGYRTVVDFKPATADEVKAISKARQAEIKTPPKVLEPLVPVPEALKKADDGPVIVVIDAGHGGVDPGAIGRRKTYEKHVTLAVSKKLKQELEKIPNVKVYMTRRSDVYVKLRDRVRFAQARHADVFVSIHADAHKNRKVRGGSVYMLSERASDKEAARLARSANRSDEVAGMDMRHEDKEVQNILIDLAQRETMNSSAHLAENVLKQMEKVVKVRKNKVQFAGFAVLKAPEIPSVLVELSYLSNPSEEKKLRNEAEQRKMARALASGIHNFIKKDLHTK